MIRCVICAPRSGKSKGRIAPKMLMPMNDRLPAMSSSRKPNRLAFASDTSKNSTVTPSTTAVCTRL